MVPHGGYIFPCFDLNHSYEDCDVFFSIAKMKEHCNAGITLSMKNCFGLTPATIYGTGAGIDEPSLLPKGGRGLVHAGNRQPSKSAPQENDPKTPRQDTYRVPRPVVDLISSRPIHLASVEGLQTITGGEGPGMRAGLASRLEVEQVLGRSRMRRHRKVIRPHHYGRSTPIPGTP